MILETIAIRKVWGALRAVPWQVYVIGALVAAIPINGCVQYREGFENGRGEVLEQLRKAEAEAAQKSLEAVARADEEAIERAEKEAEIIAGQLEAIERAEAEERNPLDALF